MPAHQVLCEWTCEDKTSVTQRILRCGPGMKEALYQGRPWSLRHSDSKSTGSEGLGTPCQESWLPLKSPSPGNFWVRRGAASLSHLLQKHPPRKLCTSSEVPAEATIFGRGARSSLFRRAWRRDRDVNGPFSSSSTTINPSASSRLCTHSTSAEQAL